MYSSLEVADGLGRGATGAALEAEAAPPSGSGAGSEAMGFDIEAIGQENTKPPTEVEWARGEARSRTNSANGCVVDAAGQSCSRSSVVASQLTVQKLQPTQASAVGGLNRCPHYEEY